MREKLITTVEKADCSFAIVTPTCIRDLPRCELLAESLDRTAPDIPHYLIVDRRELKAFRHLARGHRRLIESETILGKWIIRMPGHAGIWFSLSAPPVRGWIIQQILKIGATDVIPERTLVFCDSDVAFFRHFDREHLLVDGKIGLLDVDFSTETTRRWAKTARGLLGLGPDGLGHRNYIGNMICWNRETIKAMRRRIETSTGLDWQIALARTFSFSEYMIYGTFVRDVLGYAQVDHAPSAVPLVKASWAMALTDDSALASFFAEFDPQTVAVMIHSKDDIDPGRYRPYLQRLWAAAGSDKFAEIHRGSGLLQTSMPAAE